MKRSSEDNARQPPQRHLALIAEISLVLLFPLVLHVLTTLGNAPVA